MKWTGKVWTLCLLCCQWRFQPKTLGGGGTRWGQSRHQEGPKGKSECSAVFEVVVVPQDKQLLSLQWPWLSISNDPGFPFPMILAFHFQWSWLSISNDPGFPFPMTLAFHFQWPWLYISDDPGFTFPMTLALHFSIVLENKNSCLSNNESRRDQFLIW